MCITPASSDHWVGFHRFAQQTRGSLEAVGSAIVRLFGLKSLPFLALSKTWENLCDLIMIGHN